MASSEGQQFPAFTWDNCPIEEPLLGTIQVQEYANFQPEICPNVVMQVLSFEQTSDAELYRRLLKKAAENGQQGAYVWLTARREYRNGFRYIIVTSLEGAEP